MAKKRKGDKRPKFTPPTQPRSEEEIFSEIAQLCASPGFAHAIAYFCFRDNFVRFDGQVLPEDMAKLHSGDRLIRTEIDTLIGLLVKEPVDFEIPKPGLTQNYIDKAEALLEELHRSFTADWFKGLTPEKIAEGFNPFDDGERMREPIFYGGDSAYDFQYAEFSSIKYEKDADWLKAKYGFDINIATRLSDALSKLLTKKQNSLMDAWAGQQPHEWTLLPAFSFTVDELCEVSGVARGQVTAFVEAFCADSRSRNAQFNALSDFNEISARPIVRGPGDNYVLYQHYSLTEAIYEAPFYWMGADKEYAPKALHNRGAYTERLAFDFLKRVFGPFVFRNVHLGRAKGDEIGEIDCLILFGNRAIVLQAKSKRLTLEAKKGNDRQVRGDFKKAVQDAYDQAIVCSKALLDGTCKITDEKGNVIELPETLRLVYPICIVADHYPALAPQARQFLKVAENEGIAPPLVTDVFALDAMTEMLRSPLFFLSYLDLRQMHGKKLLYTHELVLLSTHLKHNLWIGSDLDVVLFDEGMSVDLDIAMLSRRRGMPGEKTPKGILTRFRGKPLGKILSEIEGRPVSHKIDLGLHLMSLGSDTTDDIDRAITAMREKGSRDGANHDCTLVFDETQTGLTIHCNDDPTDGAPELLFSHATLRKYRQKAHTWYGIIVSAKTGSARAGLKLEGAWEFDPDLEAATKDMPPGMSVRELRKAMIPKKVGRNDPCPCGSGRKYKKCCRDKV